MEGITVKFLRQGVALAVLGAGLAAAPGLSASASPAPNAPDDKSLVQSMRDSADGSTTVSKEKATGQIGFIRAGAKGDLLPAKSGTPAAKADAYLDKFSEAFGAPRGQLVRQGVAKDPNGATVTYTQEYKGVPVFGAMLRAHVDKDGDLTSVNGEAIPDLDLSVKPRFDKADAKKRALQTVRANPPGHDGHKADTSGIKAASATLMVYRTGLVKGDANGENQLVWRVEVTNEKNIREIVFLSADYNKPVNRYSMIHDALDRVLFEADENRDLTLVWQEGDDLPGTLNEDQESMVRSTGEAYWFFKNAFNRDSWDGNGATMYTINNDPAIQCPNANWNGVTTNYCDGVSSDDVVAHEWGHAYTEKTHGLIYQWQAGALNESYSDIWGETVDLINGRLDEGEGDIDSPRQVGMCSTHSPAVPLLTINAPSSIAKDCLTGGASFGEQLTAEGITGDVATPTDAVEEGGTATDGCSAYEGDVTGKVVLVDRGLCPFTQKAEVATDAGAAALIIGNNDEAAIGMSGDNPDLVSTVSIGLTDRESIRTAIANEETVNVTMKDSGGERQDSFRWLIGEKSEAFGGAIRDMWNPTCYGDPGKVSDAEYKCSTDDNGGVHGNSGVPNHGYALLVDGGTYNGTTIKGIGLTKAAAIYFRAMTDYQTPVSDFTDHANALEASCADLTNKAINNLSTDENAQSRHKYKIVADDCAQVANMAAAIELRKEPVQCDFQPLLPDEAGSPCGEGFEGTVIFEEDFEDALEGWTQAEELGFPESSGYDWTSTRKYEGDHTSQVAFATDPVEGDCVPGSDDISSANSLISPSVTIPDDGSLKQVLSFDHYVATETGWDGGLVRVSINGGEFETIPTDAYVVNGPNMTMETAAAGNTSPIAGEEGFSGTDGGELHGSWNTSEVDLTKLGVVAGDEVQVAFVMGRDGCNGFDGWYVDNVEISACAVVTSVAATHEPNPSRYGQASTVEVKVGSAGDTVPTGDVVLKDGDKTLGTETLDENGEASFDLGKRYPVGKHELTVEYAGDDNFDAATETVMAKVRKAKTTTKAKPRKKKIRKKGKTTVVVKVSADGITAKGRVKIYKGKKVIAKGKLKNGKAKIKVRGSKLKKGKNKLKAKYLGTKNIGKSSDRFVIRVK